MLNDDTVPFGFNLNNLKVSNTDMHPIYKPIKLVNENSC